MDLRLPFLAILCSLAPTVLCQAPIQPEPAEARDPEKRQDPDKPQPTPAEVVRELNQQKAQLEREIEYARQRAQNATQILRQKLAGSTQSFRAIDAGTNAPPMPAAATPVPIQRNLARVAPPEVCATVPQGTLMLVNGRPLAEPQFKQVTDYLATVPMLGDETVRAQRTLFDLIRLTAILGTFEDTDSEAQLGDVLAELQSGRTLAELAQRHGSVPTASPAGRVEVTRNSVLGPLFETIAFTTPVGTMTNPFPCTTGYVILEVVEIQKGASPELDKAICTAVQVPYADAETQQKVVQKVTSGQVEVLVRDESLIPLLPAMFRPAPPPQPVPAKFQIAALEEGLSLLQDEIKALEARNNEADADQLKALREQEAEGLKRLEELKKQAIEEEGKEKAGETPGKEEAPMKEKKG
jgi:hypothetical protein